MYTLLIRNNPMQNVIDSSSFFDFFKYQCTLQHFGALHNAINFYMMLAQKTREWYKQNALY